MINRPNYSLKRMAFKDRSKINKLLTFSERRFTEIMIFQSHYSFDIFLWIKNKWKLWESFNNLWLKIVSREILSETYVFIFNNRFLFPGIQKHSLLKWSSFDRFSIHILWSLLWTLLEKEVKSTQIYYWSLFLCKT